MPIYDLNALDGDRKVEATYCVIGGGIAGLLFAQRVARTGRRVVVLESGRATFDPEIHALNEIDDVNGRYGRALDGRYRALGGSSTRWGGRMIPVRAHEMHDRPFLSQAGWALPPEALTAYDSDVEEIFGVDRKSYEVNAHSRGDPLDDLLKDDPFISIRWAKCPPFKRVNVGTLLRKKIERTKNIEVWLGATVCGFDIDRETGRLKSVVARDLGGRSIVVRAEEFVLAAGAIETTRLLLCLDRATGNRAFEDCTALGRFFQDHLKAHVASISRRNVRETNRLFAYRFVGATRRDLHIELSEHAQREDAVASAFAYVAPGLEGSATAALKQIAHNIQQGRFDASQLAAVAADGGVIARSLAWRIFRKQLYLPPEVDLKLMVCAEQLPNWSNRIALSDRQDRFGMPVARIEWSPVPDDERTFQSAQRHLDAYWRRLGLDKRCPLEWVGGSGTIVDRAMACAHPSGTTRLGRDPASSVVGPDLRCHAVGNLSVASASVFPSAGSANPTLTIMRLALWLADSLAGRKHPAPSAERTPAFQPAQPVGLALAASLDAAAEKASASLNT